MAILALHHVCPGMIWGINRLTPGQLRRFLHAALEAGVSFVTLSGSLRSSGLQTGGTRAVLTFDDGYASVERWALPVLQEFGVVATVFVLPFYSGAFNTWDVNWFGQRVRHLDWRQIGRLQDAGWEIGSHGLSHRDLSLLDPTACETELSLSRRLIQRRIGAPVHSVAYPFGNASVETLEAAERVGYRSGVVLSRTLGGGHSVLNLTRIGVYGFDTPAVFVQKCLGKNRVFYHFIQRCIDICSDGTVLVKQRVPEIRRKGL
ncbi:polysaccharide deacetylase family protein [candidate division KSB1 bacterium]|nr:polysaccharide deacetylase family protein [candidate division KSB1 bacterium]